MLINFDKNNFRKDLQHHFKLHNPESYNKLQKKDWKAMIVFIDGFESCLKLFGEEPMEKKDIYVFLKSEAIGYLHNRLKEK